MAVVAELGKPQFLMTMTMNPNHPDMKNVLRAEWIRGEGSPANASNMISMNRPDLICRLFQLQKDELIKDLKTRKNFGEVIGYVYSIECQLNFKNAGSHTCIF